MTVFADRTAAGRELGARLAHLADRHPVVVGLPRGGVVVAREVAAALGAPLDVIVVRKVGVPAQPELAMGAVGEGGVTVRNDEVVGRAGAAASFDRVASREREVVAARAAGYRAVRAAVPLAGRLVVVVDDGLATGATARAACEVARAHGAAGIVLAVPVAPAEWTADLGDVADEYVCVDAPRWFGAVGSFYDDFRATDDAEVVSILAAAADG
jgi:putative phosphoribosyl transferase